MNTFQRRRVGQPAPSSDSSMVDEYSFKRSRLTTEGSDSSMVDEYVTVEIIVWIVSHGSDSSMVDEYVRIYQSSGGVI